MSFLKSLSAGVISFALAGIAFAEAPRFPNPRPAPKAVAPPPPRAAPHASSHGKRVVRVIPVKGTGKVPRKTRIVRGRVKPSRAKPPPRVVRGGVRRPIPRSSPQTARHALPPSVRAATVVSVRPSPPPAYSASPAYPAAPPSGKGIPLIKRTAKEEEDARTQFLDMTKPYGYSSTRSARSPTPTRMPATTPPPTPSVLLQNR